MNSNKLSKKTGVLILALFVSMYLLTPARLCGTSCPMCFNSSQPEQAQKEQQTPACHHAQAPAPQKHCSSKPEKPHQCCIKANLLLATNQQFVTADQQAKVKGLEIFPALYAIQAGEEQPLSFAQASDIHHHKLKDTPLFILFSALLI